MKLWPRGYTAFFLSSAQLTMNLSPLINVEMPTNVGFSTIMGRKNSFLNLFEPEKCWLSWHYYTYEHLKFHAHLSWACKKIYYLGSRIALQGKKVKDLTRVIICLNRKVGNSQNKRYWLDVEEWPRHLLQIVHVFIYFIVFISFAPTFCSDFMTYYV